ncbi:hypothetical protein D3C77_472890 [compost metagenome]
MHLQLNRLLSILKMLMACNDYDANVAVKKRNVLRQLQSIHKWHANVSNNDIGAQLLHCLESIPAVAVIPGQFKATGVPIRLQPDSFSYFILVIDNYQLVQVAPPPRPGMRKLCGRFIH